MNIAREVREVSSVESGLAASLTATRGRVLLVDDELPQRRVLAAALAVDVPDLAVASTYEEAIAELTRGDVEVLITDYRLGGRETGLDLVEWLTSSGSSAVAIMVTGFGDTIPRSRLLAVARCGVLVDYVEKPFDVKEDLVPAIARAREVRRHRAGGDGTVCLAVMESVADVERAVLAIADDRRARRRSRGDGGAR